MLHPTPLMNLSRENNFDLIRLIAAIQVVFWHLNEHLNIEGYDSFFHFISFLPGVPIFFAMSGFLIYASFERNSENVEKYFKNRFYRIYPGLWASVIVLVILLIFTSGIEYHVFLNSKFFIWIVAQLTFFQFWTPDILRPWGVGTPNGVLWTIVIEIQFYLFVPLLFWLQKKLKNGSLFLIILLLIFSIVFNNVLRPYKESPTIVSKLLSVSIFPYLYYFLLGVIFYIKYDFLISFVRKKIFLWTGIYFLFCYIFSYKLGLFTPSYWPNLFGLISEVVLIFMVFSFAYSFKGLSEKLLSGIDISYGIYVYHMIIVNTLLTYKVIGIFGSFVCLVITLIIGLLSWFIIEKPFLKLKNT